MQDHKQIREYLQTLVQKKELFHAYIFRGWSGVGKKQAASFFCKSILCENNLQGQWCGECESCRNFEKNIHFDFLPLVAEEGKKIISFQQLLQWRQRLFFRSVKGGYRIGYIESMQAMQLNSMQGLLKILEEPPQNTVILLVMDQGADIPATIYSRCHCIQFSPIFSKGAGNDLYSSIGRPYFGSGFSMDVVNKQSELMRHMLSDEIGFKQYFLDVKKILDHVKRCSDAEIDLILHSWLFAVREQLIIACRGQDNAQGEKVNVLVSFLQSLLSLQQSIKHNNSMNKALAIENILFSVIH